MLQVVTPPSGVPDTIDVVAGDRGAWARESLASGECDAIIVNIVNAKVLFQSHVTHAHHSVPTLIRTRTCNTHTHCSHLRTRRTPPNERAHARKLESLEHCGSLHLNEGLNFMPTGVYALMRDDDKE